MDILVLGGTRFFGVPMVESLLARGHRVALATRGRTPDGFGDRVARLKLDRLDEASIRAALADRCFDVAVDKIAYCSNDVKKLLPHLRCGRYILMSSAAVYAPLRADTPEADFDAGRYPLTWCDRPDFDYGEIKRQAECALCQAFPDQPAARVRYPVVLGERDYTGRLRFYAEHILRGIPMYIDDMDARIGFIGAREAGEFLAFLAEADRTGAVNGQAEGDISPAEIVRHIERRTGRRAILSPAGDPAPYNGYPPAATLSTERAASWGYTFSRLRDWIFDLIDSDLERLAAR